MEVDRPGTRRGRRLRLGLVGAGAWGRNYIRTLMRLDGVKLVAVASRSIETRELVELDCQIYTEWYRLLELGLDGVIVATPPSSHIEIAKSFIEAKIAVLVEKPLCTNLAEALWFRDFVYRCGGRASVNHIHLFNPAFRLLKSLSGHFGRIKRIVSKGGGRGPFRSDYSALWDWGPHDVSMILDLMGVEPRTVMVKNVFVEHIDNRSAENYELHLGFGEGVYAHATVGNALPRVRRMELDFEHGVIVFDDRDTKKIILSEISPIVDLQYVESLIACAKFRPPLDCALEHFLDLIITGNFATDQLDLAVSVTRILASPCQVQ